MRNSPEVASAAWNPSDATYLPLGLALSANEYRWATRVTEATDRARIRVQPPGIGAASGVVLTAVLVVGRPVQMEISTIPVRWDGSRGDWVPYDAAATGDVVAVVWEKSETLATRSGWSMPPPRT